MNPYRVDANWKLLTLVSVIVLVLIGLMLFGGAKHPQLLW